jgi:cytochrome c oxidase assembly protein subunit 15
LVNQRFLSRVALCASFFALGVIALGALTRLLDAGLGCPDWPGCYGHMIAPLTGSAYKAWAEMIHRYFVGGLSFFILVIIAMIMSKNTLRMRGNVLLCGFLILLLAYQIMLGQWTVTLKLLPVVVTQHLLGGYLILSGLWLIYLNNRDGRTHRSVPTVGRGLLFGAAFAVVLVLLQIMLGAWTSTNYASLSCPDFPFCVNTQSTALHFKEAFNLFAPTGINYEGGVLSTTIRQTIQMTHRFGAMIVTLYLFALFLVASVQLKGRPELMKSLYLMLGLLCVQLCLGISNILFKLPLLIAISHTLVAVLLLLSVLTFFVNLIFACRGVSAK